MPSLLRNREGKLEGLTTYYLLHDTFSFHFPAHCFTKKLAMLKAIIDTENMRIGFQEFLYCSARLAVQFQC